ncbi:MAG: hypothetical protein QOF77_294 [Solirubrobacteraceae bacterium]|nr:hypothetical protein [Solirubrobacteraceae bacterium]
MGRRGRARDRISAAPAEYEDAEGNRLALRGSLTAATRREYAAVHGGRRLAPAGGREDAWQRAVEFLFERLAVAWEVHGVPLEGQRELLARFRAATPAERAWIRTTLRDHCREHFPELEAP